MDAKTISFEHHDLTRGTIDGECGSELRQKVYEWLRELEGRHVIVYIQQLDGPESAADLKTRLKA